MKKTNDNIRHKKRRVERLNKTLAIIAGVSVTTSILLMIQLISFTTARNTFENEDGHMHSMWYRMMMRNNIGGCRRMMEDIPIEEMDKNKDGICDLCNMPIKECESMMGGHI